MFKPTVNALITGRPFVIKPIGLPCRSSASGSQPSQSVQVTRFFPLTNTFSAWNFAFFTNLFKLYERETSCNLIKLLFWYISGSILALEPEMLRGYLPEGLL